MQQQQLAAQLAHHGGGRQHTLSPTPSDSDSDISLGAHSPPISSPGPIQFGTSSPNPITSFRFGAHSPGPMPAQFRFGGTHTSPSFRIDRQSTTSPNFVLDRKGNSDSPVNTDPNTAVNLRLSESPIDVDSTEKSSPIRVEGSPPPMNLRMADNLRMANSKIETPLPLRLGHQLNNPLRIQVASPGRLISPHTNLHGSHPHAGIVRIATSSPNNNGPILHRPFSPPRLT